MHDSLGDRMKEQYENRTRFFLPRRTYTIVRVDGKAFHTWTRGLERPYSTAFQDAIDVTALRLCAEMQGSCFAFTQSDEISILLTDFAKPTSAAWFDGNLQKIVSVAASVATRAFNLEADRMKKQPNAAFDARAFTIPDYVEVENYFIWRQKDAERNSIQMLAQSLASHKELHGLAIPQQQDLIHARGDNWNNHPARFKRGGLISYSEMCWKISEAPIFTQEREFLKGLIPLHWQEETESAVAL
jgi:tRNA(His) guanylyltransferase